LITERELICGEMVGAGDFEMMEDVEYATPEYFCERRSMAYLFRSSMLA